MAKPTTIYGVDWSGARDAGRHAWVAGGVRNDCVLHLDHLLRGDELSGGAAERDTFIDALVNFVTHSGPSAFGFDFPFGLPLPLTGRGGWPTLLAEFSQRYPDAETFRERCRLAAAGAELKRVTDRVTKTPFCAYNLRMYRQTYWGMCAVLAPLVNDRKACAVPMQRRRPGLPVLLETCPASTLKILGLYKPYKGRTPAHRNQRALIVRALERGGRLVLPARRLRQVIVNDPGGDALDAVIAAVATANAVHQRDFPRIAPFDARYLDEAVVYAG